MWKQEAIDNNSSENSVSLLIASNEAFWPKASGKLKVRIKQTMSTTGWFWVNHSHSAQEKKKVFLEEMLCTLS